MDDEALWQALKKSAESGSAVERLAALRLAGRVAWLGAAADESARLLATASETERQAISAPVFSVPPAFDAELKTLLATGTKTALNRTADVMSWAVRAINRAQEPSGPIQRRALGAARAALAQGWGPSQQVLALGEVVSDLPDEIAEALLAFLYALLAAPADNQTGWASRQQSGNQVTALAANIRPRRIPRLEVLFDIYLSFFGPAWQFWLYSRGDQVTESLFASAGYAHISAQLAWVASTSPVDQFGALLQENLRSGEPYLRLAALVFADAAISSSEQPDAPFLITTPSAPDTSADEGDAGPHAGTETEAGHPSFNELPSVELQRDLQVRKPIRFKQGQPPSPALAGPDTPTPAAIPTPDPGQADSSYRSLNPSPSIPMEGGPHGQTGALLDSEPTEIAPVKDDHGTQPALPTGESVPAAPRYADFTFYGEFPDGSRGAKVSAGQTLQVQSRYQLEVAIRTTRTGIPAQDKAEPIREPGAPQSVEILVVADCSAQDFTIPEPVQRLVLPPTGDSFKHARFRGIVVRRTTQNQSELLRMRIRLYYQLNLIEVVIIEAEAVTLFGDPSSSQLLLAKPIRFQQLLRERAYQDLHLLLPRKMHILIAPGQGGGGFQLSFLLKREDQPDILLTGTSRIPEEDLESSLCDMRKALLGISVWDVFSAGIECKDSYQFAKGLYTLARLGRELWTKIFETEQDTALYEIGRFLWDHPLPLRCLIQISIDPAAQAFVLPWNLLYDRDLPGDSDTAPDIDGFWGLRYQLEQRVASSDGSDTLPPPSGSVDIGFLTWPFQEVALQRAFLEEMVRSSEGRIGKLRPVDSSQAAMSYLSEGGTEIICFFSHGHTQFRSAAQVGFGEQDFIKLYEALPNDSPLLTSWKDAYDQIKNKQYESDRSWIQLRSGRVYLEQLYGARDLRLAKRPIVLLNMCESAQLTPSLQRSFIHFFLDRGASAVIGTECSMRPVFAHYFAKHVLEGLFSGQPLGETILEARRHFLGLHNPLGLAYTLFGSPLVRFDPALCRLAPAGKDSSLEAEPAKAS